MREGRGHLPRPVTALCLAGAALLLAGCSQEQGPDPALPDFASGRGLWFTDVAAEAGLSVRNVSGSPDKRYLIEAKGGGAAFLDADGDGDLDIYLLSGSTFGRPDPLAHNRLYRNDNPRPFVDVTAGSGLGDTSWSMGAAAADYDNDGDADVYVTNYGANRLFENDGSGRFFDLTAAAGVGDTLWGTGAAWGDYDRDGDLDLYAANFVRFRKDLRPRSMEYCQWKGVEVFYGPEAYRGAPDVLYRNDGGAFRDVSQVSGVRVATPYKGFQPVFADLDDDGWPDIYVADDTTPNLFFRNLGDGTFRDISLRSGTSHNVSGDVQAGMGVDLGDYDGDGDLDLYVTHFSDDYNTLYRNDGGGYFSDVTFGAGLGEASMPWVGWGTAFADLDNDADLDLFVANGHVYPVVDDHDLGTSYAQPNLVFANRGQGVFEDASALAGPGLRVHKVSRGRGLRGLRRRRRRGHPRAECRRHADPAAQRRRRGPLAGGALARADQQSRRHRRQDPGHRRGADSGPGGPGRGQLPVVERPAGPLRTRGGDLGGKAGGELAERVGAEPGRSARGPLHAYRRGAGRRAVGSLPVASRGRPLLSQRRCCCRWKRWNSWMVPPSTSMPIPYESLP